MKTTKSQDVRHNIMKAAVRLFAEKGFFTTRVEDIARKARVAKGTVYLYFKDKPSLYVGIIDHNFQDAIAMLKQVRDQERSAEEKLAAVARDWLEYMGRFRLRLDMSVFDNLNLTKTIMRKFHQLAALRIKEIHTLLAEIIRQGVTRGEFRDVDPVIAAHCFLNMIRSSF